MGAYVSKPSYLLLDSLSTHQIPRFQVQHLLYSFAAFMSLQKFPHPLEAKLGQLTPLAILPLAS